MKHKNHYVPKNILKRFSKDDRISFYNKKENTVEINIPFSNQCQKNNFYSKKTLKQIQEEFSHIIINPIFQNVNIDLEDSFSNDLESPFSSLVSTILTNISSNNLTITETQKELIKKYSFFQHLRTTKFNEDMLVIDEEIMVLPDDYVEQIQNISNTVEIDVRQLIKQNYPNKNNLERRELEKKFIKFKRQNPNYRSTISQQYDEQKYLDELKQTAEDELLSLKNSLNKHTSEIINKKNEDAFLELTELNSKNLLFLKNTSNTPFILSDVGIAFGQKTPESLNPNELDIYLPISPEVCITFTNSHDSGISNLDETGVNKINDLMLEECHNCVFSSNGEYLKRFYKSKTKSEKQ